MIQSIYSLLTGLRDIAEGFFFFFFPPFVAALTGSHSKGVTCDAPLSCLTPRHTLSTWNRGRVNKFFPDKHAFQTADRARALSDRMLMSWMLACASFNSHMEVYSEPLHQPVAAVVTSVSRNNGMKKQRLTSCLTVCHTLSLGSLLLYFASPLSKHGVELG